MSESLTLCSGGRCTCAVPDDDDEEEEGVEEDDGGGPLGGPGTPRRPILATNRAPSAQYDALLLAGNA